MLILFVGDLHGVLIDAQRVADYAVALGVHELIQVGDWGFVWPTSDKVDRLESIMAEADLHMRFIDGNHDDHPRLRAFPDGDGNVSPHITYQKRGSVHRYEDGTTVGFLGGAPSIDKAYRKPGVSWWPEEIIEEEEVTLLTRRAYEVSGKMSVDILVTHDSPLLPPGIARFDSDHVFAALGDHSVELVGLAAGILRPWLLVHGHYHTRYSGIYRPYELDIHVEGLDHGRSTMEECCLLVDTVGSRE